MTELITEWGWPWGMVWREHWLPNFYTTRIRPDKGEETWKVKWRALQPGVEEALLSQAEHLDSFAASPPPWMFVAAL